MSLGLKKEKESRSLRARRAYYQRKGLGLCVCCPDYPPSRAIRGIYCEPHYERFRLLIQISHSKRTLKHLRFLNANRREERLVRKALGICVDCQSRDVIPNKVYCRKCADRNNRRHERYRIRKILGKGNVTLSNNS